MMAFLAASLRSLTESAWYIRMVSWRMVETEKPISVASSWLVLPSTMPRRIKIWRWVSWPAPASRFSADSGVTPPRLPYGLLTKERYKDKGTHRSSIASAVLKKDSRSSWAA